MKRQRWLTGHVVSWALYDVASSTWIALIPTVLFAVYFRAVIAADGAHADAYWGLTAAASMLVSAAVAPFVGAHADAHRARLRWLAMATLLCCLATAMMGLIGPGQVLAGALVFIAAQTGYMVAASLYDAYLTRIATPQTVGRVSAFGWALGFVGGVLSVAIAMRFLAGVEVRHDPAFTEIFAIVAVLFAALAIPAIAGMRRVPESGPGGPTGDGSPVRRVMESVRSWRRHGNIVRFLAALYLINDAVVTVAFFAAIYFRQQFGLGLEDLLRLILLYQLLAIPGTYIFGQIADRMSLHSAIYASLAIWVAAVLLMAFGTGPYVPALVVGLFAMVIGSTQALMRGLYAVLVPAGRSAEFFGFNAFASRLSAAAGPLAFGIVSAVSGSQRIALVSILVFLGAGALLLAGVKTRSPSAEANPEAA